MRTGRWALVALGISCALLGCKSERAGIVVDESGKPIAQAMVWVADRQSRIFRTQSDENGYFTYAEMAGDRLYVTVDADGRQQVTRRHGNAQPFRLLPDTTSDADDDGLSAQEEAALGTNPWWPDTDEDGLPDGLEARVLYPVPLVAMNGNPLRKNLYVEVDWFDEYPDTRLTDVATGILKRAFARAPISNPDGSQGIIATVDRGEFGGGSGTAQTMVQARENIFYHAISHVMLDGIFGYADIEGRLHEFKGDFSLFGPAEGIVEAIVWMHELGHNLGLLHGGDDWVLCKPNYLSVMNYNPFMTLSFSYSRGSLPPLDEERLDERAGLGWGAVDWNGNYKIDAEPLSAEIGGVTPANLVHWALNMINVASLPPDLRYALGDGRCDEVPNTTIYRDHDDWAVIGPRLDNDLISAHAQNRYCSHAGRGRAAGRMAWD